MSGLFTSSGKRRHDWPTTYADFVETMVAIRGICDNRQGFDDGYNIGTSEIRENKSWNSNYDNWGRDKQFAYEYARQKELHLKHHPDAKKLDMVNWR